MLPAIQLSERKVRRWDISEKGLNNKKLFQVFCFSEIRTETVAERGVRFHDPNN